MFLCEVLQVILIKVHVVLFVLLLVRHNSVLIVLSKGSRELLLRDKTDALLEVLHAEHGLLLLVLVHMQLNDAKVSHTDVEMYIRKKVFFEIDRKAHSSQLRVEFLSLPGN